MSAAADPAKWVVVIPSYRHSEDTIACLESVRAAAPRLWQVLVVDDASPDDSVERITGWAAGTGWPSRVVSPDDLRAAADIPGLTIVASPVNRGFTHTCNLALRDLRERSDVPYTLLLNNDAVVSPSFFTEIASALERVPDAGLVSGTIYEWDRRTIWYAGGRYNPLRALALHDVERPRPDAPRETEFISGCAMLISPAVLRRVGVLAECFAPFYSEDVDYSLRVAAAGFPLIYAPRAVVYHHVSSTLGRGPRPASVTFSEIRNRAYVVRRNVRGWRRAAGLTYMVATKPGRAAIELISGRPHTAWATLCGMVAGVFGPLAADS